MYRSLDATRIVETSETLRRRISERFPESSLARVAEELVRVSSEAASLSDWLARPFLPLRLAAWSGVVGIVAVVGTAALAGLGSDEVVYSSLADLAQGLEAVINEIVFIALAIFFLLTLENRFKRRRALGALHVLRALAHIVDMHQLMKDPERTVGSGADTASSPERALSPFELTRYLDYCSEMLALLSKVAALYVQRFTDPVTLSGVNDIEDLTSGLSRKIWQKIMILDQIVSAKSQGR